jgi:hypothetical protein
MDTGEISKQEKCGCKTRILATMEPGQEPINRLTNQPYIANSILDYDMEIDYLCPRQR